MKRGKNVSICAIYVSKREYLERVLEEYFENKTNVAEFGCSFSKERSSPISLYNNILKEYIEMSPELVNSWKDAESINTPATQIYGYEELISRR